MDRLIRFGRGEINRLDVVCASDVVVDCLGGILSLSSMLNLNGMLMCTILTMEKMLLCVHESSCLMTLS